MGQKKTTGAMAQQYMMLKRAVARPTAVTKQTKFSTRVNKDYIGLDTTTIHLRSRPNVELSEQNRGDTLCFPHLPERALIKVNYDNVTFVDPVHPLMWFCNSDPFPT